MRRITNHLVHTSLKSAAAVVVGCCNSGSRAMLLKRTNSASITSLFLKNSLYNQQVNSNHSRQFHTTNLILKEKDPYKILGVPKTATKEEIKKKFKEMAKKFHPDINKAADAKEKFAELNGAYQILVDEEKRRMYDMTGSTDDYGHPGGDPFGGGGNPFGGGGGMSREQAEEIFNQFFGRGGPFGAGGPEGDPFGFGSSGAGGQARGPRQGADVRKSIRISLKEAVTGTKKDLRINKAIECTPCNATGVKAGTKPKSCTKCNGTGTMTMQQGYFILRSTCDSCNGAGKMHEDCPTCHGEGYTSEMRTVEVTIPSGVDTGSTLRLPGRGAAGQRGGPPGDMFLEVFVEPDRTFTRKGEDLDTKINISLSQAVLGGSVEINSITDEKLQIQIPSGVQPGDKVTVKGKGIKPKNKFTGGNLNVYLNIQIPKSLSSQQRELFELYAQSESGRVGNVNAPNTTTNSSTDDESSSDNEQHGEKKGFFENLKSKLNKKE